MKGLIGIPTYNDRIPVPTASALICMKKTDSEIAFITRVRIDVARNTLVQYAYEKGLDYVLFVDDDNPPPVDGLERLLARDKDIIGSLIPKRKPSFQNCIFNKHYEKGEFIAYRHVQDLPEDEVFEIDAIGCGFTLIKTDVFKKVIKHCNPGIQEPFEFSDRESPNYVRTKPFDFLMLDGDLIGEDLAFCMRAQEIGLKIHVDQTLRIPHIGEAKVIMLKDDGSIGII